MKEWNVKYPLSHDPVRKIVRVGDKEICEPDFIRRGESWFEWKAELSEYPAPTREREPDFDGELDDGGSLARPKPELNKFFCEMLGPRFAYRYHAAQYHTWISPHMSRETANLLTMAGQNRWKIYSDALVARAHSVLPYVQEAERDGLINIIPIIVLFQKSPQEIRQEIGKGAWKRVANFSKTRNRLIMLSCLKFDHKPEKSNYITFMNCINLRSGFLRHGFRVDRDSIVAERITPNLKIETVTHTFHMVGDTRRMLGDRFNPNWSYKRMEEEHKRGVRELNRKRYSAEPFAEPWHFEKGGYSASLLTSPLDIATEGATQHHCVGSYANEAKRGSYAVFSVYGKERATIGVRIYSKGSGALEQVYGACNAPVSEGCKDFAYEVTRQFLRNGLIRQRECA